jgi:hypothetical protein
MKDEADAFAMQWIGEVVRLDVPTRSVVNLRRVAGELRALALRLDCLSRTPDDPKSVLFDAAMAIRHTNKNLRAIRRPGRPHKM